LTNNALIYLHFIQYKLADNMTRDFNFRQPTPIRRAESMSKTQGLGWIQRYKKGKAGEGDEEAHMNLCGEQMGCAIGEIERGDGICRSFLLKGG
jgi:hypothetical protein